MSEYPYLKNAWYVAAWSSELGREILERTIIERSIALYRKEDGAPVAIDNRCPHRSAPLHLGKLCGDTIQCPYHGLRFAPTGRCVHNPHGDGRIPQQMAVRSYPVVERHKMIWLWMGDPVHADAAKIPDFSCHEDESLACVSGVIEMKANYQLIADNLLDLAHAVYVHEGVLSSEAIRTSELETIQNGSTIYSNRWCPNGEAPPAWSAAFDGYDKPVDHWLYMRWDAPAHLLLDVGVTPAGGTRKEGVWVYGTDILTPKDEFNTYYFWAVTRAYKIDAPEADEFWRQSIKIAFEGQDEVVIEAQQRMIGRRRLEEMQPVLLSCDAAAQRARRVLGGLIAEDAIPAPTNPSLQRARLESDSSQLPVTPAV